MRSWCWSRPPDAAPDAAAGCEAIPPDIFTPSVSHRHLPPSFGPSPSADTCVFDCDIFVLVFLGFDCDIFVLVFLGGCEHESLLMGVLCTQATDRIL